VVKHLQQQRMSEQRAEREGYYPNSTATLTLKNLTDTTEKCILDTPSAK
jgi:hypothetical protein